MADDSGEIIVKGGSVQLIFDNNLYQKQPNEPNTYKDGSRKITSVQVEDEDGKLRYDSGTSTAGLNWTITVSTEPTK